MRLHRETWAGLGLGAIILAAANLWCWSPGIGGGQPHGRPGAEVELYYGWPATYRAEWWRSDDPALVPVLLRRAPFFHPSGVMDLQHRYVGVWPALADAAFALAALAAVCLGMEAQARGWRRGTVVGLVLAAAVMVAVWRVADRISVHL
jgi:hypothetical protein